MGDQIHELDLEDFIRRLRPCSFRYHIPVDDGRVHHGFIAQDVDQLAPKEKYGFVGNASGLNYLNYTEFIGPIVAYVQRLEKRVGELERQLKGR